MKVLIVAKTRRGAGACVGGITQSGRSVRLIAADAATNERAGLEYEVGEVWEVESSPDPGIVPPHVENIVVLQAERVRRTQRLIETIHRFMPPVAGGPEVLFDGLAQCTPGGGLYIADRSGLPSRSTMFWAPNRPLKLDYEGKRIRYRYPTEDGGRTLTFVGFQEPLEEIPAGTLLRVSLAHRWRPQDKPEEELRCFVQLSGWFLKENGGAASGHFQSGSIPKPRSVPPEAPIPIPLDRARGVLKRVFGFSNFFPVQADVIQRVLRRADTLVVMPTGGGKSLCYQLPALMFDGLTVVVSPLIALMQDQVRQMHQLNVPAAALNHTVALEDYRRIAERVRSGNLRLLYAAPETLLRPETLLLLEQGKLACLAIDEGHCISEWGHDFRPEYRQLRQVRQRFPNAVCLVLTATATERVRQDIRRLLEIPSAGEFIASFNRQNLFLAVEPRRDAVSQIVDLVKKHPGESGIIYCGTRQQADEIASALTTQGRQALPYHAGLEPGVRHRNQEQFINDDVSLIVATIAFGMGINKPDVRFVIHAHLPKDIESYYQEIGRSGRDGLPADCLLLYSRADAITHRHFIDEGAASERPGRQARLSALLRFAQARECRRMPLLRYFGEELGAPCGHCDNCARKPDFGPTEDVTVAARKFLQCVQATGQRFGPAHIIAILRGSKAERVLSRGHERLSAYGQGKEYSTQQWHSLAEELVCQGVLDQDLEFGGLHLTEKGRDVLAEKEKVMMSVEHAPAVESPAVAAEQYDEALFQHFRALRKALAEEAHMPSFYVFSDRTLIEMATRLPRTESEFLAIHGVGESKLEKYGAKFLEVIQTHCSQAGLLPKSPALSQGTTSVAAGRPRFRQIGELFAGGEGLDEIARRFGILPQTVVQHLCRYREDGGQLDPDRILAISRLSVSDREAVISAFERLGLERLAPVFGALSGRISFEELHVLRLYCLCRRQVR